MRFEARFPDGTVVAGDLSLPAASIPLTLASQLGFAPKPSAASVGQAIARSLLPRVAAAMLPLLPPAAASKVVKFGLDRNGKVTATESVSLPTPVVRAAQIARQLEPHMAAYYELAAARALKQSNLNIERAASLYPEQVGNTQLKGTRATLDRLEARK